MNQNAGTSFVASTSVCGLTRAWLARLDALLGALLLFFLAALVLTSARANIQADAVDYYAIVQCLVGDEPPILPHLPFVEQRSPGYPLLSLPAYYLLKGGTFWVETETVRVMPLPVVGETARPSEQALLPPQPLRFGQIFQGLLLCRFGIADQDGVLTPSSACGKIVV